MTLQKPNPQITKIKGQSRGHWPPRPSCHALLEWFYGRIKHSRDSTVKDRRSKKVRLIAYIEFSRRARVYRTGIREIRLIPVVPFQLSVACTVAVYNSSWSNGLSTVITPCNTHTHIHIQWHTATVHRRNTITFGLQTSLKTHQLAHWCLHCALSCGACSVLYCNRPSLFVSVCGSVTTITRNCEHRSSPNLVCICSGLNFGHPATPGMGSAFYPKMYQSYHHTKFCQHHDYRQWSVQ